MISPVLPTQRMTSWLLLGLWLSLAGCFHASAPVEKSASTTSTPTVHATAPVVPAGSGTAPDPTAAERAAAAQAAQLTAAMQHSPRRAESVAAANDAQSLEAPPPIRWIEVHPTLPEAAAPAPTVPMPSAATAPAASAAVGALPPSASGEEAVVASMPDRPAPTTMPVSPTAGAEEASLKVRRVELCRRVRGYGVYDPMAAHSFLAGKDQRVIVYVELDNFKTRKIAETGVYQVKLRQEVTLYTLADGAEVWKSVPAQIVDESRNQRRDFFVVQMIDLPARLTVGKYMLKVRVTDLQGDSVDEASLPLTFVADPGLVRASPR